MWTAEAYGSDALSQIVEGWSGQPWGKPYYRIRDYVTIMKKILRRIGNTNALLTVRRKHPYGSIWVGNETVRTLGSQAYAEVGVSMRAG